MMIAVLLIGGFLTTAPSAGSTRECGPSRLPRFAHYAVDLQVVPDPKLDLNSHVIGRRFRTVLTRAVRANPPNLAGHFLLVEWGCGTSCGMLAIVDLESGKLWHDADLIVTRGVEYRADSRLVIINTGQEPFAAQVPTSYYAWRGDRPELICQVHHQAEASASPGGGSGVPRTIVSSH
ncbi:MAG TPA: hypothetical protein VFE44_06465 [Thermoanaerobaculia bacterium]|nr:hypothetical protein [Thermoanaerobaculia bacterium]